MYNRKGENKPNGDTRASARAQMRLRRAEHTAAESLEPRATRRRKGWEWGR